MAAGERGPLEYGELSLWAMFRCNCGALCGMADQPSGNAAMVHATPHCDAFESAKTMQQAVEYFKAQQQLTLTQELQDELQRSQAQA